MRTIMALSAASFLLAPALWNQCSAQTIAIAVDYGGDYDGASNGSNSPLKAAATTDTGDFNGDAITDARTFVPIDSSTYFIQLDNAFPPGLPGKSNKIHAGAQVVDYSTTSASGINLFRYNGAPNSLQMTTQIGTSSLMGAAFAPHVRKADFLNGLASSPNLSFADQADGFLLDWTFNATPDLTGVPGIRRARMLVQDGSDWFISETTSGGKTPTQPLSLNPYTETWYPYDPSTSLFYGEVGGGNTSPLGMGVAGSTFSDIQALGALLINTSFNGGALNEGNLQVRSFSASLESTAPSPQTPMRIVDSAATHALWHMDSITSNVTVEDMIFDQMFTSDAILDDDSNFPRADYQNLLLGPVFGGFPASKRPTLTTGGGGVFGEALDFDPDNQQEAIAVLAWLGDGDDGTGNINPANSLDTMYTDFWFRERDHDGTQFLVGAGSTWEVTLGGDEVKLTVWDSNFGNNTISVDLDVFGTDGEPDAKWRNVVAFVDESSEMSLSVDGVTVTGTLNGTVKPQRKSITLGNKENQARWFNGLIDEVYIGFEPPTFAMIGVPGDYNGDGFVDAADYTVWRDTLGSETDLRADGDGNQIVELADYEYWKSRFGNTSNAAIAESSAVPEPTALALLGCVCLGLLAYRNPRVK